MKKIDPMKNFRFDIDDKVRVVNTGLTYVGYKDWVVENHPEFLEYWIDDSVPAFNSTYKILAKGFHENGYTKLYLIGAENNSGTKKVYLMEESAITLTDQDVRVHEYTSDEGLNDLELADDIRPFYERFHKEGKFYDIKKNNRTCNKEETYVIHVSPEDIIYYIMNYRITSSIAVYKRLRNELIESPAQLEDLLDSMKYVWDHRPELLPSIKTFTKFAYTPSSQIGVIYAVGDDVAITDRKQCYDTYDDFLKKHNPELLAHWKYKRLPTVGKIYKVVLAEFDDGGILVYVIQDPVTEEVYIVPSKAFGHAVNR